MPHSFRGFKFQPVPKRKPSTLFKPSPNHELDKISTGSIKDPMKKWKRKHWLLSAAFPNKEQRKALLLAPTSSILSVHSKGWGCASHPLSLSTLPWSSPPASFAISHYRVSSSLLVESPIHLGLSMKEGYGRSTGLSFQCHQLLPSFGCQEALFLHHRGSRSSLGAHSFPCIPWYSKHLRRHLFWVIATFDVSFSAIFHVQIDRFSSILIMKYFSLSDFIANILHLKIELNL